MINILEGITVIDMCHSYPPAFGSMFLADYGANVIRIDRPGRRLPIPIPGNPERIAAFLPMDRNKKSLTLNLKTEKGRRIFHKLAENADVILENSRPGVMDQLGIGYETINSLNPEIIYCSVSGYGQTGPYKSLPGHDINYLSIAGCLDMIGEKGGPPVAPSNFVADMAGGGLYPLIGILLALLARQKTGRGQFIDISYTDAVFSLMSLEVALYYLLDLSPKRGETMRTGNEPFMTSYLTKDEKWVSIAMVEPFLWKNFCNAIGREDLLPKQYPRNETERQELFDTFKKLFKTKTRDEWWQWSQDKDIALTPVLELSEALEDPQIKEREMAMKIEHSTEGTITHAGFAIKMSDTPAQFKNFSPQTGEQTKEIMISLGYTDEEIKQLQFDKII